MPIFISKLYVFSKRWIFLQTSAIILNKGKSMIKIKKSLIFIFLPILLISGESSNKASQVTLIVTGDIFPSPSLIKGGVSKDGKRNYLPYYEYVTNIISSSDIAACWFGGPVAGKGEEFAGYPCYNNPPEFISAAIDAGFDIFFHTNHLLDRGIKGLIRTLNYFKSLGTIYLGAFLTEEESKKIYYVEKNGIKIAFLSYLYGANMPVKVEKWMINYIDLTKITNDIMRAKEEKADFIVVALHWGNEYERFPSEKQKKMAREIASAGADLILGSHPHVIQPAELIITTNKNILHKTLVIYSFGNFLSSQRKRYSDCGIIAKFIIEKNSAGNTATLKSSTYIPTWVKWTYSKEKNNYITRVLPILRAKKDYEERKSNLLSKEEYEKMLQAYRDTVEHLDNPEIPFLCDSEE